MAKRREILDQDVIKIYYFHGFGSGRDSSTAAAIKKVYPNTEVIVYDTTDYEKALAQFNEFFKGKRFDYTDMFIGSSLGGYWANRFCSQFGVQTILINPGLDPNSSLRKYDGEEVTGYDDKKKIYRHKDSYVDVKDRIYPRVVFIGEKDEVVDYKYTEKMLKDHSQFVYLPGEGHTLKDLTPVVDMILKMANNFT